MSSVNTLIDLLLDVASGTSGFEQASTAVGVFKHYYETNNFEQSHVEVDRVFNIVSNSLDNSNRLVANDLVNILHSELRAIENERKQQARAADLIATNHEINDLLMLVDVQFKKHNSSFYPDLLNRFCNHIQDYRADFHKLIDKVKNRSMDNQSFIVFALEKALALNKKIYPSE